MYRLIHSVTSWNRLDHYLRLLRIVSTHRRHLFFWNMRSVRDCWWFHLWEHLRCCLANYCDLLLLLSWSLWSTLLSESPGPPPPPLPAAAIRLRKDVTEAFWYFTGWFDGPALSSWLSLFVALHGVDVDGNWVIVYGQLGPVPGGIKWHKIPVDM